MKKILVVDDSELNVLFVSTILEKDYAIYTAFSGEEALRMVQKEIPDLIILDIVMRKVSGLDVCKEIRENPKTANIPIILLTATNEALAERGYRSGADEVLGKPIKPERLKEKISKLLQRPII